MLLCLHERKMRTNPKIRILEYFGLNKNSTSQSCTRIRNDAGEIVDGVKVKFRLLLRTMD